MFLHAKAVSLGVDSGAEFVNQMSVGPGLPIRYYAFVAAGLGGTATAATLDSPSPMRLVLGSHHLAGQHWRRALHVLGVKSGDAVTSRSLIRRGQ